MSIAGTPRWSLRLERAEVSRLTWAFAISLALHLLVFGTYQTGKKYNLWQSLHWPAWLLPPKIFTELLPKKEEPRPSRLLQDIPLVFVNVSPAQASPEPPKNAPDILPHHLGRPARQDIHAHVRFDRVQVHLPIPSFAVEIRDLVLGPGRGVDEGRHQ